MTAAAAIERETVPFFVPVVTDPVPRPPRAPVKPLAPEYVGRHRMPGWVARIGSGAIPVHHLTPVHRSGMAGTTAMVLLVGALTVLLTAWLLLAIAYTSPAVSSPEPWPVTDGPAQTVPVPVPGGER